MAQHQCCVAFPPREHLAWQGRLYRSATAGQVFSIGSTEHRREGQTEGPTEGEHQGDHWVGLAAQVLVPGFAVLSAELVQLWVLLEWQKARPLVRH